METAAAAYRLHTAPAARIPDRKRRSDRPKKKEKKELKTANETKIMLKQMTESQYLKLEMTLRDICLAGDPHRCPPRATSTAALSINHRRGSSILIRTSRQKLRHCRKRGKDEKQKKRSLVAIREDRRDRERLFFLRGRGPRSANRDSLDDAGLTATNASLLFGLSAPAFVGWLRKIGTRSRFNLPRIPGKRAQCRREIHKDTVNAKLYPFSNRGLSASLQYAGEFAVVNWGVNELLN